MVHRLHEGGVCLADGQTGPAAPHVPAENTHQDREGKQACRQRMRVETRTETPLFRRRFKGGAMNGLQTES